MSDIKVLIADSDVKNLESIKSYLLDDKFDIFDVKEENIFTAKDGLEAFGLIGLHDMTYLFSEIDLKHLTGTELIEVLQDIDKLKDTRIVFMTSTSAEGKIPPLVKKTMFGILAKPISLDKFVKRVRHFIDTRAAEVAEEKLRREKIREGLKRQKEIVTNVISKYLSVSEVELDHVALSSGIDAYLGDDEALSDDELMIIIPTIVGDYFAHKEVSKPVESKKISYIFKHQTMQVDVQKNKNQKKLFTANILNDSDVEKFLETSVDVAKYAENAKELKTITENTDSKTIVKNRFKETLKGLAKEQKDMEHSGSLDYTRTTIFLFKAKEMICDIDFTVDDPKFAEYERIMKRFREDIDYFNEFRTRKAPEYFFDEIYKHYQKTYLTYRYTANKMFEQKDSNPEYRAIVEKLDKKLQVFKGTGTQIFYNTIVKQINIVIKTYLNLLNNYTFEYNKLLWDRAKQSSAIKDFFMTKGIEGSVSLKSLLSYYVRITKLQDKELAKINLLSSMLSNGSSRRIVYLSANMQEAALLESYVKKIESTWQLYTLAKISLIESWFKTNKLPDVLIVDYNFNVEVGNGVELMEELLKKVEGISKIGPRMMIFNSISIEDVEAASSVGCREYAKRPLLENEMINKIRFL
jgi:CheY-like chemotaxis protein